MRVFRRDDIKALRVLPRAGEAALTLEVVHVDLYLFFDVEVAILNVEVAAKDLSLAQAQQLLYRFGRAYPAGWSKEGAALHSMAEVHWLGADGNVLASSDAQARESYLSHVAEHRAPRVAAHWAHVMEPLVSDHSGQPGTLRYRQIEYYRMPVMAYLAVDNPRQLQRNDFVRLTLATDASDSECELFSCESATSHFEREHCYDRFWNSGGSASFTRYLCSGHALVVVGDAQSEFFNCGERGVLAQFRHQHFMLFLIAHFQKAALLMFSSQLVEALQKLNLRDTQSIKGFKRAIRFSFERFLRFTHRYWFHEVSEQVHVRALYHLCARHLDTDALYKEVKERVADMNSYLDADSIRRQANTVVRLTVVTMFGLIGTITTGFLGMNLLAEAEQPLWRKLLWFGVIGGLTTWLTFYTLMKSHRLSDFIDALSNQRISWRDKFKTLMTVWKAGGD